MKNDEPVLLFDGDGVIVTGKKFSQHLADDLNWPLEKTKPFFSGVFQDCLEGRKRLDTEIKPYLKEWGYEGTVDNFLKYWFTSEHVVDEAIIALIQRLRKNGIKCYVATNQEKFRVEYMWNDMEFSKIFDEIFSSADLGVKKPSKQFFLKILQRLDNPDYDTVWFFDDTQENVDSAIALGLHAFMYTNIGLLESIVSKQKWLK